MVNTDKSPASFANLANNSDDDISVVIEPLPSEQFYVSQGNYLKALVILCEQMKDASGKPLVDACHPPWCYMQKSSSVKPTAMS